MERSNLSARELYEALRANPTRARFGFGRKPALVNVDFQNAYTRPEEFVTAYETDPQQICLRQCAGPAVPSPSLPRGLDLCVLSRIGRGLRRLGHPDEHARLAAEHQGRLAA